MLELEQQRELKEVFTNLLRINTSNPPGGERAAAEYIAQVLEKEGIPARLLEKAPGRTNVYAEIGQGSQPPVLLLSHIDVVPAPGSWEHPPFDGVSCGGTIWGRGAIDTKHLTAMEIMCLIWLQRSGMALDRKVILLASADEELGSGYGMAFIAEEHPELLPRGYVVSEGGGFVMEQRGQRYRTCTCGEKGRCAIQVTAKGDPDGYGPWNTQAGQLLRALRSVASYQPEPRLTAPTQAFHKAVEGCFEDRTLKNLWEYSVHSCLAADAYELDFTGRQGDQGLKMSYQYIDGTTRQEVEQLMEELLGGEDVSYEIGPLSDGYTCDLDNPFFQRLCQISQELDPGTRILPMIALGRTDGRFIRHNVYGYSPLLPDVPFSEVLKMVHGPNERITESSLSFGAEVLYRAIVKTVEAAASEKEMEECSNG